MSEFALYRGAYPGPQVDEAISRALPDGEIDQEIAAIRAAVGTPLVAATAAAMTDREKIYVYTGSEAGYTTGHWYYWDGAAWADGGAYNAAAADAAMSSVSINAVQNKVIKAAIDAAEKSAKLAAYNAFPAAEPVIGSFAGTEVGADNVPLKALIVSVVRQQSGSGDPSPDNKRPISGWGAASISRLGKNWFSGSYVGAAITLENNVYKFNPGLNTAKTAVIPVVGGETYTITKWAESNRFIVCTTDHYPALNDPLTSLSTDNTATTVTVTVPAEGKYLCVFVSTSTEQAEPLMQVELGEAMTAYEAYKGRSYAVNWTGAAGTVYGGTITDKGDDTWTLTVGIVAIDMGAAEWKVGNVDGHPYFYISASDLAKPVAMAGSAACEVYNAISWAQIYSGNTGFTIFTEGSQNIRLYDHILVDAAYTTNAERIAALKAARNGDLFVYSTDEPDTYTISAESVRSLLGDCFVFADCGPVNAAFRCDTTLYIQAALQAGN